MVDSSPTAQGPPSNIKSTFAPKPSRTCCAVVGLMRPDGLAEGATIGRPNARKSSCATACRGTRRAMDAKPAEASSETLQPAWRGKTKVKGPGQNRAAKVKASEENTANSIA